MLDTHLTWRELASTPWAPGAVSHLVECDLCQQRLLKLAYQDLQLPALPDPLGASLRAHLELRIAQSSRILEIWPRILGPAEDRVRRIRKVRVLRHLPMAHLLLQDARQILRPSPEEARVYAAFALEILGELDEMTYLVADAQAAAHLVLAEADRRGGNLFGRHLTVSGVYRLLGTDCPRLEADYCSEAASYRVDTGRFAGALAPIDRAVHTYRELEASHSYAVALVKRSTVSCFLDPFAGAADALGAIRWMRRQGIDDRALRAAAQMSRIDCLLQAGQAERALRILTRHGKELFAEGAEPLFLARLQCLSARLLLRLGLPDEAELVLRDAIAALEPLHPQDAARAKLLLIHHLAGGERWEEAASLIHSADEILDQALWHPDLGELWRALMLHLLRSEPTTYAAQGFLRRLLEVVVRPSDARRHPIFSAE